MKSTSSIYWSSSSGTDLCELPKYFIQHFLIPHMVKFTIMSLCAFLFTQHLSELAGMMALSRVTWQLFRQ